MNNIRTKFSCGLFVASLACVGCGSDMGGGKAPGNAIGQAPANPQPGAFVNAAAPAEPVPPGLYGDTGGEEVAAADPSLPGTMLRGRADDTFYAISNARLGQDRFGRPTIMIDYEVKKNGTHNGIGVVLHGDDGTERTVLILGAMQGHGTLPIEIPFTGPGQRPFPKNIELFFTRNDPRYGQNAPTFKVSNSTVIGTMQKLTRPRNWTKEEQARLSQPPPNYANANVHTGVGTDTEVAGDATGGLPQRYVEPGGHLLGLEWRGGEWDGEKCFGGLVPVFKRDQPATIPARVIAKDGYAVGGVQVQSLRFVDAIRLVFHKIKPDGTLDPADSYESEWFGFPGDKAPKVLSSGGKPVIGIKCQQGAILNGLALVVGN